MLHLNGANVGIKNFPRTPTWRYQHTVAAALHVDVPSIQQTQHDIFPSQISVLWLISQVKNPPILSSGPGPRPSHPPVRKEMGGDNARY